MKLLISGPRKMGGETLLKYLTPIFDELNISVIIHGGAKGVDTVAGKYGAMKGLPVTVFKPDYDKHGKIAPIIRNSQMVLEADAVICVYDRGAIRKGGTGDTYRKALKAGKLIAEIIPENDKVIYHSKRLTLF